MAGRSRPDERAPVMSKVIRQRSTRSPPGEGGLEIRAAEAGDLDRIEAIERASFSDPWSRRSFQVLLGDDRMFFRVADLPDVGVIGYVVAWFAADEAEIANIAVAAEARGRGVGAALLDASLAAARAHGAECCYLDVRESNHAARRLYASRRFLEIGRRRGYYTRPAEDALVLRCHLAGPDLESRLR